MDGTDVNAVHRSPSGRLLASSDDFGSVNVFRYPAIREGGSEHSSYSGHSSHVTCVRWASLCPTGGASATDDFLISTGGEDKCVFQWRNQDSEADATGYAAGAGVSSSSLGKRNAFAAGAVSDNSRGGGGEEDGPDEFSSPLDDAFALPGGGDEFTAVKPWLGAIVAPSAWSHPDPSKVDPYFAALGELSTQHRRLEEEGRMQGLVGEKVPAVYADVNRAAAVVMKRMLDSGVENASAPDTDELELDWVHGYRGFDCRNNVFYIEPRSSGGGGSGSTAPRSVVYYAAALGIVLNPCSRTQKYFRGHTDDIVSMAVHKGACCEAGADAVVATGQQGIGSTFIWEVPSMKTLATLKTKQKNVSMLEFSRDGKRLISIGDDKQVAVSDWKSQTVLSITKGEPAATFHIAACGGLNNPAQGGALSFLTCGDKHIRLWTLSGRNLTAGKVVTSTCPGAKIQLYLCAAEVHGKYLVGCDDGAVYVIPGEGKGVKAMFEHHTSDVKAKLGKNGASLTSLHVQEGYGDKQGCLIYTGAKNGTIVVWDGSEMADSAKFKPTRRYAFDISSLGVSSIIAKQIQSICMFVGPGYVSEKKEQPLLLVGTRGCDILEVQVDLGENTASLYTAGGDAAAGGGSGKDHSGGVVMQAHCNDELWGVATHPTRPEYCTVGTFSYLLNVDV
jgi:WD40 repeat protein